MTTSNLWAEAEERRWMQEAADIKGIETLSDKALHHDRYNKTPRYSIANLYPYFNQEWMDQNIRLEKEKIRKHLNSEKLARKMAEDKEKRAKKKICEIILARRIPIVVASFHVTHSDRHLRYVSENKIKWEKRVYGDGLWSRKKIKEKFHGRECSNTLRGGSGGNIPPSD